MERACRRCGEVKPLSGFTYQRRSTIKSPRRDSDGHAKSCKECYKKTQRARIQRLVTVPVALEARCSKCKTVKPRTEFFRDRQRSTGVGSTCRSCNREHKRHYHRQYFHSPHGSKTIKERNRESRLKALRLYGGYCVCCGEDNPAFLTFDHILNNGHNEPNIARRVLKKFDETLRLLCYNCNCGRQFGGFPDKVCPHEFARSQYISLAA